MTGPYGRLNHFGHLYRDARRDYVDWFKTFADIIADFGRLKGLIIDEAMARSILARPR